MAVGEGWRRIVLIVGVMVAVCVAAEVDTVEKMDHDVARQTGPCKGLCGGDRRCVLSSSGKPFCVDCSGLVKRKRPGSYAECCSYDASRKRCVSALKSSALGICRRNEPLFVSIFGTVPTKAEFSTSSGYACGTPKDFRRNGLACKVEQRNGTYKCFERTCTRPTYEAVQAGREFVGTRNLSYLGGVIALSPDGTYLAIGDRAYGPRELEFAGRAQIFRWNQSNARWVQVGQSIEGTFERESFGLAIAISPNGRRVAVGSEERLQVFDLEGGRWVKNVQDIEGRVWSLRMSADGSRLAFGTGEDDVADRGVVKIMQVRRSGVWARVGQRILGEAPGDRSSIVSMSADGKRVAIGGVENSENLQYAGHVRVFDQEGTMWKQVGEIDGEFAQGFFGSDVALSSKGNYMAVASLRSSGDNPRLLVFRLRSDRTWARVGQELIPEFETERGLFQVAISANGRRVAIGSLGNFEKGRYTGNLRLYEVQAGSVWVQLGEDIDGEREADYFGDGVAMSADGTRVAVGAMRNDNGAPQGGQVKVFDFVKSCV